jgi:CheY-like chemotaxis protein
MAASEKVLVVDDDSDYRATVRSILESHGYAVVEAESGKDGLRKVVEHKPDLILLDIMMECCYEGYSLNQAIKYSDAYAEYRDIPIVMASSIEQPPDELFPMAPEVEMIRPDRYVTKPLNIPVFLDVIQKVLASRHPQSMGIT